MLRALFRLVSLSLHEIPGGRGLARQERFCVLFLPGLQDLIAFARGRISEERSEGATRAEPDGER